jgi:hypothetical protein
MVDPGQQEKPIGKSAAPRALLSKNKWALSKTNASISTLDAQATLMEGHVTIEYGPLERCSGKNVALHALLSKSKIKTKETKISVLISITDAQATLMEGHVTIEYGPLVRCSGKNVALHARLSRHLSLQLNHLTVAMVKLTITQNVQVMLTVSLAMIDSGLPERSFGKNVVNHAWQFNQETITIKAHPFQQLTTFQADVMGLMTHMQSVPNM